MRKFLTHLLMLLMLVPGLACGPFMNAGKAHAAQSMQGMENCHGMGMESPQKKPENNSRFFFKDCLKVDLGSAVHVDMPAPDLIGKVFFTAWAITTPTYSFLPTGFALIRGPPPDWPDLSHPHSSILTTQRLRI